MFCIFHEWPEKIQLICHSTKCEKISTRKDETMSLKQRKH